MLLISMNQVINCAIDIVNHVTDIVMHLNYYI